MEFQGDKTHRQAAKNKTRNREIRIARGWICCGAPSFLLVALVAGFGTGVNLVGRPARPRFGGGGELGIEGGLVPALLTLLALDRVLRRIFDGGAVEACC